MGMKIRKNHSLIVLLNAVADAVLIFDKYVD